MGKSGFYKVSKAKEKKNMCHAYIVMFLFSAHARGVVVHVRFHLPFTTKMGSVSLCSISKGLFAAVINDNHK